MCVCVCVCLYLCSPRPGVRLPHAEAPVHVWKHQQPPRARRPHPEHLVAAAGDGAEGAVRGGGRACVQPLVCMRVCMCFHLSFALVCLRSASGGGRPRWRSCRRFTLRPTSCCTAPTPSGRNWTVSGESSLSGPLRRKRCCSCCRCSAPALLTFGFSAAAYCSTGSITPMFVRLPCGGVGVSSAAWPCLCMQAAFKRKQKHL